jgi:pyrimidine-specific ribonucleoside hydrolase
VNDHPRAHHLLLLACLALAGCATTPASPSPNASPSPAADGPIPVIVDADMDQSDVAALAVLLRDPGVDVRAVTVPGTGLVHCAGGRRLVRYVLEELGRPDIPYACGREDGGPDALPFPEDWRAAADDAWGLPIPPQVQSGLPPDAVDVFLEAVATSPRPPLVVALGPLTVLEDVHAADPSVVERITGIHAMLGAVEAPGNVLLEGRTPDDRLEWNAVADPSAVEAVFAADVPITLVPLDATDDVPVPADLGTRLEAIAEAGGANLVHELILRQPSRLDANAGQQLWDELAALTVTRPDLATWQERRLAATLEGGTVDAADGRPVRVAMAADPTRTVDALIEVLGSGPQRATPVRVVGWMNATWDGTTCAATAEGSGPGFYRVAYTSTSGAPSAGLLAGVRPPEDWSVVEPFLDSVDLTAEPQIPEWLIEGVDLLHDTGDGSTVTGILAVEDATYGVVCAAGEWPDLEFHPSEPVLLPAG